MKIRSDIVKGVLSALFPILVCANYLIAQDGFNLVDKVSLGSSQVRYYLHYDLYGNSPEKLGSDRLDKSAMAGDEIVVRFYPNVLFSLENLNIPNGKSIGNRSGFFLFPSAKQDTFSVQYGYGAVYFATKEKGRFDIRISKDTSKTNVDGTISTDSIRKELRNQTPTKLTDFNKALFKKGFDASWDVWVFEDVFFDEGVYSLEVFQSTPNIARLIDRIKVLHAGDIFRNVVLFHRTDLSIPSQSPMVKTPELAYFEGIVTAQQTVAGVHNVNVKIDYSSESWYFRQAPTNAKDRKIKATEDEFTIRKEQELPSSVRARAGYAVFDGAREARLVTNFVLVLSPEQYFLGSTGFVDRINPTVGLQIGGTGTKDVIFLLGVSYKLINEADVIFGLRFGREAGDPWVVGTNFYFGASLDPGLFGQLRNAKQ